MRNKVAGSYFVMPGQAGPVGEQAPASRAYKLYWNNGLGRAGPKSQRAGHKMLGQICSLG